MCAALIGLFAAIGASEAQAIEKNPFRVEVVGTKLAPKASDNVVITIVVPDDHHVYRDMMYVKTLSDGGLTVAEPSFPPGYVRPDPANPAGTREMYDTHVIVEVPVTAGAKPGDHELSFEVAYQGCRKTICWLPQIEQHTAKVTVTAEES